MLLTSSIRNRRPRSCSTPRRSRRSRRFVTGGCSEGLAMATGMDLLRRKFRRGANGDFEGLVEIAEDVLDMLDADREPDGFGRYAGVALLLRRHLPMRGRRRMATKR